MSAYEEHKTRSTKGYKKVPAEIWGSHTYICPHCSALVAGEGWRTHEDWHNTTMSIYKFKER